jgi:intracellular multiplication protein IcmL
MAHDALETVMLRNNFYRDNYRKIATALMAAMVTIIMLVGTIFYLISHQPSPKYFATTDTGKIIPLIPLDQPNINSDAIRQWATNAAVSFYSYNFVNYRQTFSDSKKYFTSEGWQAFLQQLQDSGNLKTVQDKKLIVSAVPTGVPVIQNEGVFKGRYFWRIQIPMLISYEGEGGSFHNNLLVTMTIQRISTLDREDGVGVEAFVAEEQGQ